MSKTEENLKAAFAGESQARNKYTYFAKVAHEEGYHYIGKIFEETALNEMQHARDHYKMFKGLVTEISKVAGTANAFPVKVTIEGDIESN